VEKNNHTMASSAPPNGAPPNGAPHDGPFDFIPGQGGPPTPEMLAALPHDNAAPRLNATLWTLTGISLIFLALRVYCKSFRSRRLWWDDWILIAAWVCELEICFFPSPKTRKTKTKKKKTPPGICGFTRTLGWAALAHETLTITKPHSSSWWPTRPSSRT
jgi:hypothetical protein